MLNLDEYQAILLDLDGTVYREEHPLPGAVEFVRLLNASGRKYACLSNSTLSPEHVAARLGRMGIAADATHIYTAAAAAVDYVLQRHGPWPRIFNLATEGVQEMLSGRCHWVHSADERCDAIIVGTPTNVYATEERQRIALMLLRNGAELVGTCADRVFPSPRGLEFGAGALCAYLGYAANVTPVFCGKPQEVFFHNLCQRLGVEAAGCLLIGDNIESDIVGGRRVGMRTILTLSGITEQRDLERLPPEHRPDAVFRDLAELVEKTVGWSRAAGAGKSE